MELPDEPRAGGDGAARCAEGGAAHPQEYLALTRPRQPTGSKLLQVPIGKFPANGAGNQPFWLKKLPQPFWLEQQSQLQLQEQPQLYQQLHQQLHWCS